jgi:type IX secretion system PorP/SprF family membrane protein
MRKINIWCVTVGCLLAGGSYAQQDPIFTHFSYNKLLYNPAYAGASDQFCLNAITHQQWRGYEDQTSTLKPVSGLPTSDKFAQNIGARTTGAAFSAPISIKVGENKLNIGGVFFGFMSDRIAYENNTFMRGGIAGAYTMANGSSIRLGFDVTSLTKGLDGAGLRYHDPGDPYIPTGTVSDTKIALGLGLYYSNPEILDGTYVGVSMQHLAPKTYVYGTGGSIKIETARHIYIVGGTKIDQFLSNPSLRLEPAVLLKTVVGADGGLIKPQLDLQGMLIFNNLYAGGLNLRAYGYGVDAMSIMLGFYPPIAGNSAGSQQTLRVGYSYDVVLNNIRTTSWGTHEIQVNYCFNFGLPSRPPKIYRHPRWMQRNPNTD